MPEKYAQPTLKREVKTYFNDNEIIIMRSPVLKNNSNASEN